MKRLTEIKIQDNKIIIDDEIFYDFNNRYHNISALSVEKQIEIFSKLINSTYTAKLSTSEKNEYILIYTYLFKILSAKNGPASILTIGNNSFINIIYEIINLFNSENKLYYICDINNYRSNNNCKNLISIVASTLDRIDFLASNNFAAVLVDLQFIKSNIHDVLSECCRLLDRNGTIICYGSNAFISEVSDDTYDAITGFYQLSPERFLISVNISNKDNISFNSVKEDILNMIEQESANILDNLQYIMSNRPTQLNDIWFSRIDDCIYIFNQIESIITKHYHLFENENLKYQTNEVKNALLDFKYEAYLNRKHYDFFQANLFDCYNDWITNIR